MYMAKPDFSVLATVSQSLGDTWTTVTPSPTVTSYLTPLHSLDLQKALTPPLVDHNFTTTALIYLSLVFFCKKGYVKVHGKAGQGCLRFLMESTDGSLLLPAP